MSGSTHQVGGGWGDNNEVSRSGQFYMPRECASRKRCDEFRPALCQDGLRLYPAPCEFTDEQERFKRRNPAANNE